MLVKHLWMSSFSATCRLFETCSHLNDTMKFNISQDKQQTCPKKDNKKIWSFLGKCSETGTGGVL